jgi:cytochrome c
MMRNLNKKKGFSLATAILMAMLFVLTGALVNDAKAGQKMNPCGVNPCGVSNPCGAKMKDASDITPIRKWQMNNYAKVAERGERLWVETTLGKSGKSCASCHPNGANLNSKPYPKYIKMADDVLTLDQMINFCMINPMKGKALSWNSQKMTALAAYVSNHSKAANPCGMKNPCGVMNPCAGKNPCGGM